MSSAAYSERALAYFASHAINPDVAEALGVREEGGALVFPYRTADGGTFARRGDLNGGRPKVRQPDDTPLQLWKLGGSGEVVLVCEGESDALAARSALLTAPLAELRELPVVAVPGAGFSSDRLAAELAAGGFRQAWLAFDGDDAGRSGHERAVAALHSAGIKPFPVELPDGRDLADCLADAGDPGDWLANTLIDTEAAAEAECHTEEGSPADRTSWAPIDLAPLLDGRELEPPPTMLTRTDGVALIYESKVHAFHGEPEACKGWLAAALAVEVLDRGGRVLYLDFEDAPEGLVARLLALGMDKQAITDRFHYARPDEPLDERGWESLAPLLAAGVDLAVIDGVTEALTLHGLELNDNSDVARWLQLLPQRLKSEGIATVQIDHVVKDREGRRGYAIGGQHKKAGIDVTYDLEVINQFGRGRDGLVKVKVTKDRPGHVRAHEADGKRIADMRLYSDADSGAVTIRLDPPADAGASTFRPTCLMERVSRAVEDRPGLSKREVRALEGSNEHLDQAVVVLLREKHLQTKPDGQAIRHYSLRPYREEHDRAPVPEPCRDRAPGTPESDRAPVPPPIGHGARSTAPDGTDLEPDRAGDQA